MAPGIPARPLAPEQLPQAHGRARSETHPIVVQVKFPDRFQGIFKRMQPQLGPMLVEAREKLKVLPVRSEVFPYYSYGVLEHPQPSFMLLPLMYLSLADHAGGIGARHRRHLPWLMLAMEACAILDDTVDSTPSRSGRASYPGRFGAASAAPFSAFLISTVVEHTAAEEPAILPLITEMFSTLCALETWEFGSRYPTVDHATLAHWLECRYDEVTPAVSYGLDAALLLHDAPRLPLPVATLFAEIFQDVDDLVNFAESRGKLGENDDLEMGMVTHLLLSTIRQDPSLATAVEALWLECRGRTSSPGEAQSDVVPTLHSRLVGQGIVDHGVPATVAKIIQDADQCIQATPVALRSAVEEMVLTFIDRIRGIDSLRAEVNRRLG